MEIATLAYKKSLASRGIGRKIWSFVRRTLIKLLNDPTCTMPIHGKNLKLPLSHLLPLYLKKHPFYDRLPQRISEYMHQKHGYLNCIDVGANIGDTIASFYREDTDIFLAIEPNPKFNKLLSENWGWNNNVTIISDICSSDNDEGTFVIKEKDGTASILLEKNGVNISKRSLDEIVNNCSSAVNVNVLKIDTDGHDFEVIEGSRRLLSRSRPVVLFECDVFNNVNYVQDVLKSLNVFKQSGYNYFLLYNNLGYLIGKYSLSDMSPFNNLLFYQLISNLNYFDVLVMKDEDIFQFYKSEVHYFVDTMSNKSLQRTVISAVKL